MLWSGDEEMDLNGILSTGEIKLAHNATQRNSGSNNAWLIFTQNHQSANSHPEYINQMLQVNDNDCHEKEKLPDWNGATHYGYWNQATLLLNTL